VTVGLRGPRAKGDIDGLITGAACIGEVAEMEFGYCIAPYQFFSIVLCASNRDCGRWAGAKTKNLQFVLVNSRSMSVRGVTGQPVK